MSTPPPPAVRHAVLDTDTFNEVDDQFALAHLLLSPGQVALEAVYAAPFDNSRSTGPADGMEKSFEEIHRLLGLVRPREQPAVRRGSRAFLPDARTPVESEAARDLVERAHAPRAGKLLVGAIAAATNVASALLLDPGIAGRIAVCWLGGHAHHWPDNHEFNLAQDAHAARVLFESGVELLQVPCLPVASHLLVTVAELEKHLAPGSELGDYLTRIVREYGHDAPGWSKTIWDIAVSAWLVEPGWLTAVGAPAPLLREDLTWEPRPDGPPMRVVRQIDRDAIFADFYAKARTR